MGRAKNTLDAADVSSTPIKVNYSVTYSSESLDNYGITARRGVNMPYSASMISFYMNRMNNYRFLKQFYYSEAVSASIGSASFYLPAWQSTAASGSNDETIFNFPTQSGANVSFLTIPRMQFGEELKRTSVLITSSLGSSPGYKIVDDGNGNLIDAQASNTHVGNVFYAQGIVAITNSDYVGIILSNKFSIAGSVV